MSLSFRGECAVCVCTSSCLLASSFLCMRDSLVRRLLKCMSFIMFALFVVTSFTDCKNKQSLSYARIQALKQWQYLLNDVKLFHIKHKMAFDEPG